MGTSINIATPAYREGDVGVVTTQNTPKRTRRPIFNKKKRFGEYKGIESSQEEDRSPLPTRSIPAGIVTHHDSIKRPFKSSAYWADESPVYRLLQRFEVNIRLRSRTAFGIFMYGIYFLPGRASLSSSLRVLVEELYVVSTINTTRRRGVIVRTRMAF